MCLPSLDKSVKTLRKALVQPQRPPAAVQCLPAATACLPATHCPSPASMPVCLQVREDTACRPQVSEDTAAILAARRPLPTAHKSAAYCLLPASPPVDTAAIPAAHCLPPAIREDTTATPAAHCLLPTNPPPPACCTQVHLQVREDTAAMPATRHLLPTTCRPQAYLQVREDTAAMSAPAHCLPPENAIPVYPPPYLSIYRHLPTFPLRQRLAPA
ncbi:hypothetical protein GGX14DRAFT_660510 [Mycena pura]|uniref:Uncharacterized protein n=1 Tax=Mycena pura TaxID=153505 RepID=A0AAD6Y5C0_9AGAR|nr:hypothetical protein GGX14DRAFT_660510 [Mycena pura]